MSWLSLSSSSRPPTRQWAELGLRPMGMFSACAVRTALRGFLFSIQPMWRVGLRVCPHVGWAYGSAPLLTLVVVTIVSNHSQNITITWNSEACPLATVSNNCCNILKQSTQFCTLHAKQCKQLLERRCSNCSPHRSTHRTGCTENANIGEQRDVAGQPHRHRSATWAIDQVQDGLGQQVLRDAEGWFARQLLGSG